LDIFALYLKVTSAVAVLVVASNNMHQAARFAAMPAKQSAHHQI
jgi:hypothetical protein